jgi:GxxExxY protein
MFLEANARAESVEGGENLVTDRIIGAAFEVHRHLGSGLLESAYEECFCFELNLLGLSFQRQLAAPIVYKGLKLDCAYRLDVLVENSVIVELKAIEALLPIHSSQLLSYLKAQNKRVGLLINFNVPILKNGLKRIVNRYVGPPLTEDQDTHKNSALPSASPRLGVESTAPTDAVTTAPTDHPCYSAS